MGSERFFSGGVWIIPLIMIIICFLLFRFKVFGSGGFKPPWLDSGERSGEDRESETALEILEKRYAKGEIMKNEFEQMKKDLQT